MRQGTSQTPAWVGVPLLLAALLVSACRSTTRAPSPPLENKPPRVVSLHDVTTEIVVALGAVDRLAGVGGPVQLPPEVIAAVAGVPRVDGAESILAVQPSVVLGMAVVEQRSPELVRLLRGKGIEVWLGHPARLEDVLSDRKSVV